MSDQFSENLGAGVSAPWRRKVLPWVQLFGLVLLAVAVWMVLNQRWLVESAWTSLKACAWWQGGLLLLLPAMSWVIVTILFWVLTNHRAPVRLGEMAALIGSAWLLNIVPLRPGLMGRVAYHTLINQMTVKQSVAIILFGIVANAAALGLAILTIATAWFGSAMLPPSLSDEYRPRLLVLAGAATLALLMSVAWLQRARGEGPPGVPMAPWRFVAAVACRFADFAVWTARYWLAFAVIGMPIGLIEAAGVAAVSQLVQLLPVSVGPREWAVGLVAGVLPSVRGAVAGAAVARTATGLTADLVNRAAELAVSVPVGLVCTAWVYREIRRAKRRETAA